MGFFFQRRSRKGCVERGAGLWSWSQRTKSPPWRTWGFEGGAPLQPVPGQGGTGQRRAGKAKIRHGRAPVSWGTVPQFPRMPHGDKAVAAQALGKRHVETDFPKDSLLGSRSRGAPAWLLSHLLLRQVSKIAPVTHGAQKGRRVPDTTLEAAGCFPGDGTWGQMPPLSLQLCRSLRRARPLLPRWLFASLRFSSHGRCLAVARLHSQKGHRKYKCSLSRKPLV